MQKITKGEILQMDKSTYNIDTLDSEASMFAKWKEFPITITRCIQAAKHMHQAIYDINAGMIDLAKISNATSLQLNSALKSATEAAQKYGTTISDVINVTNKNLSSTLQNAQSDSNNDKNSSFDVSNLINKLFPDIKNVGRVKLIACP